MSFLLSLPLLPCAIFLPKTPFLLTTVILREKTNATTIVSVYVLDRQTQGHLEIKIVSLLFNQCKKKFRIVWRVCHCFWNPLAIAFHL